MSMRQLKITKSITNREFQSLEKYLQEIGRIKLLSNAEEEELAVLIRKGDKNALERLIKANLRFVVSVAKQYQNQGLTLPDLINEGNLGLIKAARRFDETKGFKFISYAIWWIRQSILQALIEQSRIVRLPFSMAALQNKIAKGSEQLEQELQREPTAEELADFLKVSAQEVVATQNMSARHISVDSPLSEDEDTTLIDVLVNRNISDTDEELVFNESLKMEIDRSLKALTERQKNVVCFFYGIGVDHPLSLEDIGQRYSLSRERVRQIKDQALIKLRSNSRTKELKGFLC